MTRKVAAWQRFLLLGALGSSLAACGGEIVEIGHSGNRIAPGGLLEEVAEALAENPGTPRVTDEMLVEIFSAILGRASRGDPEAARIVLQVAEQQRAEDEQ